MGKFYCSTFPYLHVQYLLTNRHYVEASDVLNVTCALKDSYTGNNRSLVNTFYQVVQVAHLLIAGQVSAHILCVLHLYVLIGEYFVLYNYVHVFFT